MPRVLSSNHDALEKAKAELKAELKALGFPQSILPGGGEVRRATFSQSDYRIRGQESGYCARAEEADMRLLLPPVWRSLIRSLCRVVRAAEHRLALEPPSLLTCLWASKTL